MHCSGFGYRSKNIPDPGGRKLAACCNIVPGLNSITAGKIKIQDEPEILLIF